MSGGDYFRMIRQAEVVVGTEVDDRVRFAAVVKDGARFRRPEQLRLVQFDRPLTGLMPFRENRRRMKWIFAVPDEKIAQAEVTEPDVGRVLRFHFGDV